MKPTRFLTVALILIGLVAIANAAGTPAGTEITNQAQGSYNDANGNEVAGSTEGYLFSNEVSTFVSQVAGADLGNDQGQNISALGTVLYQVLFTNTGNGDDSFGLAVAENSAPTGDFTYEIYSDGGTLGVLDGSDAIITSTGSLSADGTYNLIVKVTDVTVGGAGEGDVAPITLTATSVHNGSVTADVVLTTTVQAATVLASITTDTPNPVPGDLVTYSVCITNNGTAIAYDVVFTNLIPDNVTYSLGSITTGTTGWANGTEITDEVDSPTPDAGDFDGTTANTITVNLGNLAAGGGSICVYYQVTIDVGLAEGTTISNNPEIDFDNEGGTPYPTVDPTGDIDVDIAESFSVDIASTGTTSFIGDPSDSLFYPFSVQNLGNGTDFFNLTVDSYTYVNWVFYADDGDGILSTTELSATTAVTGPLGQSAVAYFVAVGVIPAGTADTAPDATTFKATSDGDNSVSDTDTASAVCTAPILTLVKSVNPPSTVESGLPPGTVLTYTIVVANSGTGAAANVVVSDAFDVTWTSYVEHSLTIDGSAQGVITDASDDDGGTLSGGSVVFDFDTLDASGGTTDSHTLTFQVTIN